MCWKRWSCGISCIDDASAGVLGPRQRPHGARLRRDAQHRRRAVWTLPLVTRSSALGPTRSSPGSSNPDRRAGARTRGDRRSDSLRPSRGLAVLSIRQRLRDELFDVAVAPPELPQAGCRDGVRERAGEVRRESRQSPRRPWLFTTHPLPDTEPQHAQDASSISRVPWHRSRPPHCKLGPCSRSADGRVSFTRGSIDRRAIVIASTDDERDWPAARTASSATPCGPTTDSSPCSWEHESAGAARESVIDANVSPGRRVRRSEAAYGGFVGILDGAALVISPDTGPLHVAAALNRPDQSHGPHEPEAQSAVPASSPISWSTRSAIRRDVYGGRAEPHRPHGADLGRDVSTRRRLRQRYATSSGPKA